MTNSERTKLIEGCVKVMLRSNDIKWSVKRNDNKDATVTTLVITENDEENVKCQS